MTKRSELTWSNDLALKFPTANHHVSSPLGCVSFFRLDPPKSCSFGFPLKKRRKETRLRAGTQLVKLVVKRTGRFLDLGSVLGRPQKNLCWLPRKQLASRTLDPNWILFVGFSTQISASASSKNAVNVQLLAGVATRISHYCCNAALAQALFL